MSSTVELPACFVITSPAFAAYLAGLAADDLERALAQGNAPVGVREDVVALVEWAAAHPVVLVAGEVVSPSPREARAAGWLTVVRASELTGVSKQYLTRLCRARRLRCVRAEDNWSYLIDPDDIAVLVAGRVA